LLRSLFCLALFLYVIVLFVRVILSWVFLFRPGWYPPTWLRPILDLIYGLVDPPVNYLRRVLPQPVGLPIDLSFLVWFLIVIVVQRIVC
jgi:YggT family protein